MISNCSDNVFTHVSSPYVFISYPFGLVGVRERREPGKNIEIKNRKRKNATKGTRDARTSEMRAHASEPDLGKVEF